MRARSDQRQVAGENDVEQLRQFVEAGFANEAADPGDARVVLGDELFGRRVGLIDIHRAELVNLYQLVVETVAALLEQHRAFAIELDGQRDEQHDGCGADQRKRADDFVEQPFRHHVPVGDRLVENVDHRDVADIGIGARPKPQLVGVRGEADVDRQHPELFQHLQDAALGGNRQREDHQINPGVAGDLDQVVHRTKFLHALAACRAALIVAIVEYADDAHVGSRAARQASR